jgi:hypothetical protein
MTRIIRRLLRRNVDLAARLRPYVDNGWPR